MSSAYESDFTPDLGSNLGGLSRLMEEQMKNRLYQVVKLAFY